MGILSKKSSSFETMLSLHKTDNSLLSEYSNNGDCRSLKPAFDAPHT